MPYAHLTITIPDQIWISDLSQTYPETTFRVLAATANDRAGVAKIEILEPAPDTIKTEIQEYDAVVDLTVLETDPAMTVQIETTMPLLMTSLQDAGVPLEMPFAVRDGKMSLATTIPSQTLSVLGETLEKFGIPYTVDRIRQDHTAEPVLTDRQQWLIDEALDRGYYDTPREITLVELADAVGIAKSTCSELLHRAEEQVLKTYFADDQATPTPVAVTSD